MLIIVPVDFSVTSQNAALYALQMLKGRYEDSLMLYHVYYLPEDRERAELTLEAMKQKLSNLGDIRIVCRTEHSLDFADALSRKARHEGAAAIVMGINERSKLEQAFLGSDTLKTVGKTLCPVIIVPKDAKFKEVRRTALVCDMANSKKGIPFVPIKAILTLFRTTLYLLYVSEAHYVCLNDSQIHHCQQLEDQFAVFKPASYFLTDNHFQETLLSFIKNEQIDLLICIPNQPSFLEKLYMPDTLKQLAFNSKVPVLAAQA